jgi:hypothetical protein
MPNIVKETSRDVKIKAVEVIGQTACGGEGLFALVVT